MYSGDGGAADQARQDEINRESRIDKGMANIGQTFAGFDDKFYGDREKAYEQYATPELTAQSDQTRKSLTYAMARAGLLNSSANINSNAALDREVAVNQRKVADQALQSANDLRSDVEGQRSSLVSQLEASADPSAASSLALAQASRLRAPTPMQPLGDMFADFTNLYGLNARAQSVNPNVPGLFAPTNWSFGGGGNGSSEQIIQ